MIVFQIVMGPAQAGNAAKGRGEVQRAFAEDRIAVTGGAVIGDAPVDSRRRGQGALIGFVILGVHIEQSTHVFQELPLG